MTEQMIRRYIIDTNLPSEEDGQRETFLRLLAAHVACRLNVDGSITYQSTSARSAEVMAALRNKGYGAKARLLGTEDRL